jgi:hypothetical protein
MVLVSVVSGMGQHDVGLEFPGDPLEGFLDIGELSWEEAIAESKQANCRLTLGPEETPCAVARFRSPDAGRAKHDPVKLDPGPLATEFKYHPPTANLDVIGMRAETQYPPGRGAHAAQPKHRHRLTADASQHVKISPRSSLEATVMTDSLPELEGLS